MSHKGPVDLRVCACVAAKIKHWICDYLSNAHTEIDMLPLHSVWRILRVKAWPEIMYISILGSYFTSPSVLYLVEQQVFDGLCPTDTSVASVLHAFFNVQHSSGHLRPFQDQVFLLSLTWTQ